MCKDSDDMKDGLSNGAQDSEHPQVATCKVQLFRAGPLHFGVSEEYVATLAQWREPTPLPHAPESVLGVVSIQGRMLTVLDLARLCGIDTVISDESYRHIIALRGDEQLALAASALSDTVDFSSSNSGVRTNGIERFVSCVFTHSGADARMLNVSELFAAALHGRERRRRRF